MQWKKYNYINTIDKIRQLDQYLMSDNSPRHEFIAVDTETNGLDLFKASVIGFSLSVDHEKGFYIPLVEWVPDKKSIKRRKVNKVSYESYMEGYFKCVWTGKTYEEFFTPNQYELPDFIPVIINRWFNTGAKLIMHNAPFDVNHIFTITGVDLKDSLFFDTTQISHLIDENESNGLKETAIEWRDELVKLGFNAYAAMNQEQQEMALSVIRNGGKVSKSGKAQTIWRAEPEFQNKYACADTFLTFALFKVGVDKYVAEYGERGMNWFFNQEVMPVCKEVVIPMKRKGVYVDVPYFKKIEQETRLKMEELEDKIIDSISDLIQDFTLGKSIDEAISNQRLVKKIIELEGLSIPKKYDKKTETYKETLAKAEVKKAYQEDPHWLWGYILGEDEIKYSDKKIANIKSELYQQVEGRRYQFNIGSDDHLRWLFCNKLGLDKKSLPQTDSASDDNPIPSMKAEVLEEHLLKEYPWVKHLMLFKKLRKFYSSYIMPAINLNINGWLYMNFRQDGTISGRFSCSGGFNLQTLPRVEEIDECPKCESKNLDITYPIELVADRKCNDCGFSEEDIICPSAIKKGFVAPPGYKIVNADYSSLEPRCFAYMSGDDKLKEVYWDGLDLYSKVYCDVLDVDKQYSADPKAENFLKKVNKPARTFIKPVVLGIPYGSKDEQVASLLGKYIEKVDKNTGNTYKVPDAEYGKWFTNKYLGTYKDLHAYMLKQELACVTKGYVESLIGRRRHFKWAPIIYKHLIQMGLDYNDLVDTYPSVLRSADVRSTTKTGKSLILKEQDLKNLMKELKLDYEKCVEKGYWSYVRSLLKNDINNAKNWPIQSLAGHITNKGMLDTERYFRANNVDAYVCLQVHDEITVYAKEEQAELASQLLKKGMEENEFTSMLDVPMIAEPLICDNIKDAK